MQVDKFSPLLPEVTGWRIPANRVLGKTLAVRNRGVDSSVPNSPERQRGVQSEIWWSQIVLVPV